MPLLSLFFFLEFQHWSAVNLGDHLILVGDPLQLPPLVHSRRRRKALQLSMMERLILQGHRCDVLDIQHRSHHTIAAWSSQRFYDSALKSAEHVAQRTLADNEHICDNNFTRAAMVLVNVVDGAEVLLQDRGSLFNPEEVFAVCAIVKRLLAAGTRPEDLGIIAPYQAQVDMLVTSLSSLNDLAIRTVDSFQGGEREVIGWVAGIVFKSIFLFHINYLT